MRLTITVALFAILFTTSSCRTKKTSKTAPVTETVIEQLDTIHIVASRLPEKRIYRGSNSLPNDLLHTKLEVEFDWKAARMNGKATLKLKPYFYPVSSVALNARGMEIRSVEVFEIAVALEGKAADKKNQQAQRDEVLRKIPGTSFKYADDSLRINLGKDFANHEQYYVVIDYVAKPNELGSEGGSAAITDDKGLYFVNPTGENPYKMPQIWTQGETQSSSVWFPTIDSPNEKMTQEILMTVDDKYTTLSNGILVSTSKNGAKRTDHWKLEQSHAPYLAMMAVGEFVKVVDEPWNGKEISYYVEKEYAPHAKAIFGETRAMIDYYSKTLGVPYEWGKYAQIAARDYVSGAMENTSATLHGDFMVYQTTREIIDGRRATAVIAHELFHQWFGDLVTCESWSNLPLNESFATYGEYMWEEFRNGRDAADEHLWQSRQGYMHQQKEVDLIRFNYEDKEDMFDAFSYNKGGQVLHMLRKAVGDEAFYASLKKYLTDNKYKPVEIHHLRLAFEEVTGRDMNWFFNQWFLNKGRPKLKVTSRFDPQKMTVQLIVEQNQDLSKYPLYTLPLEVAIYANGDITMHRIVIDDQKDTFNLAAGAKPQLVNFDAERQLLAEIDFAKTEDEYVFQYRNAPLFADRMEALQKLEGRIQDSTGFYLFHAAAIKDKNPTIRKYAITKLEKTGPTYSAEFKGLLTEIFLGDSSTTIRALALAVMNRRFMNDGEVINLTSEALKEQSYAICAEALNSTARRDPAMALQAARRFEHENGKDIIFAVASVYSTHGSDAQLPFFRKAITYVTGFDIMVYCAAYSRLAQRCSEPASVLTAATDLEMLGKGGNKYTKFGASKGLKDLLAGLESKETALAQKLGAERQAGKPVAEMEKQLRDLSEAKSTVKAMYERAK